MIEPLCVALLRYAVADEGQARRAERQQFVSVYRQVARRLASESRFGCAVLQKIPGHPVIFTRPCKVLDSLTPVATMKLRSTLTGGTDQNHRETRIEGHRHEGGFAITRD